jgi:Zn-dependent protease
MSTRFSVPLFRVAGIPVRLSLLFPLAVLLVLVSTPGYATSRVLTAVLGFAGILLGSTLLHEAGHAFAARRERLRVHEIRLDVLGGWTTHDEARSTGAEVRVALAGVAVNLAVALGAGVALRVLEGRLPGWPVLAVGGPWLETIWGLNLWLAAFNLLPGIPFDGGHAVEALLARKFGRVRGRTAVVVSGAIIGTGLLVGGVANGDFLLTAVAVSCLMAVGSAWKELRERRAEDPALFGVYDFSNGYTSLEASEPRPAPEPAARARDRARREREAREAAAAARAPDAKERLDRLLDRIAAEGIASLSAEERSFLNDESRRLRDRGRTPTRP